MAVDYVASTSYRWIAKWFSNIDLNFLNCVLNFSYFVYVWLDIVKWLFVEI